MKNRARMRASDFLGAEGANATAEGRQKERGEAACEKDRERRSGRGERQPARKTNSKGERKRRGSLRERQIARERKRGGR